MALEEGVDVAAIASASPAIIVPETLDPINLLGVLRRARGSFVIVTNEFGVVQGLSLIHIYRGIHKTHHRPQQTCIHERQTAMVFAFMQA